VVLAPAVPPPAAGRVVRRACPSPPCLPAAAGEQRLQARSTPSLTRSRGRDDKAARDAARRPATSPEALVEGKIDSRRKGREDTVAGQCIRAGKSRQAGGMCSACRRCGVEIQAGKQGMQVTGSRQRASMRKAASYTHAAAAAGTREPTKGRR